VSDGVDKPGGNRPTALGSAPPVRLRIAVLGSAASPHDTSRTAVFARRGHDVAMLSIAHAAIPGVRFVQVAGGDVGSRLLRRLALMVGTVRAILREKPDIWHAHYAAEYGTWAAALLRRRPLVVTVMGGDVLFEEQGAQGRLGRMLTRFALRRADLVLVKSNALGEVVGSFGVPASRIMRVIWGIDLERFKADPVEVAGLRRDWRADGRSVLLAPRMLQPFYNHHLLIAALPAIIAAGHDPVLVLAEKGADPACRADIETQARDLGVADRLRFTPPRAPEAMASLYAAADVVVSLAPSDGMPQTPIEAGAVDRPTVMTDLARYRELFTDGENVVMTPLDDVEIARRICDLLASPGLRARIASGAHRVMRESADLSIEAARVEARYHALIAAQHGEG
jgi:glycosyltransferase involved in cell wall biosynthesis